MKNIFIIVVFFSATWFSYSQRCFADEYLKAFKERDPKLESKIKSVIKSYTSDNTTKSTSANEGIVYIPVVFNVIHNGEPEGTGRNVALSKLEEQIDILNEAYGGEYGGVDTEIRFCIASKDAYSRETSGVNRYMGATSYDVGILQDADGNGTDECDINLDTDYTLKSFRDPAFPSSLFLNIWIADIKTCGEDTILGYSSFPFYVDFATYNENNVLDGVVIDYKYIGSNSSNGSSGITAVHEVGHWLGLFHVFQHTCEKPGPNPLPAEELAYLQCLCEENDCLFEGDMICDTDKVSGPAYLDNYGGPCEGKNCANQVTDVVKNYMNYNDDNCMTIFTQGQKERMRDILSSYRGSIYMQGRPYSGFDYTTCSASLGLGGTDCSVNTDLPVQVKNAPHSYFTKRNFGSRLEVNDKWLVVTDAQTEFGTPENPPPYVPDYVHIYKREGCQFAFLQSIQLDLNYTNSTINDFGLILNDDEIIVCSYLHDSAYIYQFDEDSEEWGISQIITHLSNEYDVAISSYCVGRFLFITQGGGQMRVYYKNSNGYYNYHQTIVDDVVPVLNTGILAVNLLKSAVNINSSSFVGTYDPPEILLKSGSNEIAMYGLQSNNLWNKVAEYQVPDMLSSERFVDMDITDSHIHVLTKQQTGHSGSAYDKLYTYSFRVNENSTSQFSSGHTKQEVYNFTNRVSGDSQMKVINNEFLFIDNLASHSLHVFYNTNYPTSQYPNWQASSTRITCKNGSGQNNDDFEFFGNLLFVGFHPEIRIYDMADVLDAMGHNQSFIDNSTFYNKSIRKVPEKYTTYSKNISISGVNYFESLEMGDVERKFIAKESIVMRTTSIVGNSDVTLKLDNTICDFVPQSTSERQGYFEQQIEPTDIIEYEFAESEGGKELYIYPNPATSTVDVRIKSDLIQNLIILTTEGKKVIERNVSSKNLYTLDISNLSKGVYILTIQTQKGNFYTQKLIKN
ncbi:hypothetical protein GCM10007424_18630 [Flavobacterium suaedae]|uniref:T9SS type A sorting domain-containing protein n=1 Tax=Flavobacterium suaedae TaxID=1767027 RepID=A0ABQ1JUU6_9FLAO|nr:zinc-dependent metalloprotease [Flavobacterium suaedae]GGB78744.1 hypothetical protein GCM10007424_18630 [Flavobacterium suaedae]